MRRLIAVTSTAFLTFFAVAFGMRFAESSVNALLTAQVTQPQIQFLPDSFQSELKDIYPGPDGNIWVIADDLSRSYDLGVAKKILRVKPDGTMANSFPLDAQDFEFRGQIFGGKLWLMFFVFDYLDDGVHQEQRDNLVSIAPDGSVTSHRSYRIRSKGGPDGIVSQTYIDGIEASRNVDYVSWIWEYFPGPDGFLWAESEGNWYKVSPSGEFTPFTITPPSLPGITPAAPNRLGGKGMSKGGDGNMWEFAEGYDGAGKQLFYSVSITPQGISTAYPVSDLFGVNDGTCQANYFQASPSRLTVGSDGNMWYSYAKVSCAAGTSTYQGKIGKILHDGTMQTYALPDKIFAQGDGSYYHQGVAMVGGPDGNIWFMYSDLNSTPATYGIGKITPNGTVTLIPTPGYIPSRIASGADGNIWFVTRSDYTNPAAGYSAVKIGKVILNPSQSFSSAATASSNISVSSRSSAASVAAVTSSVRSSSAFVAGNRCGNGILNSGEVCDDANTNGGDGCSSSCVLELGYDCSGIYCFQVCGDGIRTKGEECDDNNRRSGDGCSAVCLLEAGPSPSTTNTAVTSGTCGNGVLNSGETCDDANRGSGDGCSAQCAIEDGFACYLTACVPVCGDGKTRGTEQCDDNNKRKGDGCSDYCKLEPGYSCVGTTCSASCGDGIPLGGELCDDGNARAGDGCFACAIEVGWYCGGRPSQCYRYPFLPAASSSAAATLFAPSSSQAASADVSDAYSSSSASPRSSMPFLLPDWSFNMASSSSQDSSIRFFSRGSVASSSSSEESSEPSSESSQSASSKVSSSSESSSSVSSESVSSVPSCGNGILDGNEECDAGSLNGTPVSQCGADCVVLKSAAAASSSADSQPATQTASGEMNPILLMILVALFVIIVGGVIAYAWFKIQQKVEK